MDEADLRVRSDVETFGWHVAKIAGDEKAPPWSFTIGLEERFDHPEILIFGMEVELLHSLLNHLGEMLKRGRSFRDNERAAGVLENHPPLFRTVLPRWYGPFVGNAGWYYREREFRVLQCFWPDVDGILPWEPGFDGAWVGKQPLLFEEDESTALGAPLAALLREEGAL